MISFFKLLILSSKEKKHNVNYKVCRFKHTHANLTNLHKIRTREFLKQKKNTFHSITDWCACDKEIEIQKSINNNNTHTIQFFPHVNLFKMFSCVTCDIQL